MANITSFPLVLAIVGDGSSLTATVGMANTPTSATLISSQSSSGMDLSSNIASVAISGSSVVITFIAFFTGTIFVELAVTNSTYSSLPLQPVAQITSPWITRETKDINRTELTFFIDNIGGSATEVLATMGITKGDVAQTPATSYTVTSGKTLRLGSISYTVRSSTNAQQISQLRVRTAASGILATSPIILNYFGEAPSASTYSQSQSFPEGYEIVGGTQIAMSHIEIITAGSTELTACLVGYEY